MGLPYVATPCEMNLGVCFVHMECAHGARVAWTTRAGMSRWIAGKWWCGLRIRQLVVWRGWILAWQFGALPQTPEYFGQDEVSGCGGFLWRFSGVLLSAGGVEVLDARGHLGRLAIECCECVGCFKELH